ESLRGPGPGALRTSNEPREIFGRARLVGRRQVVHRDLAPDARRVGGPVAQGVAAGQDAIAGPGRDACAALLAHRPDGYRDPDEGRDQYRLESSVDHEESPRFVHRWADAGPFRRIQPRLLTASPARHTRAIPPVNDESFTRGASRCGLSIDRPTPC